MAIRFSIDLRAALRNLFPDGYIRQLARTTGATKRLRNVDPVHLFWTLVLGFGVERERTLADLRRRYIRASGRSIEESSFYDRFTGRWVKLLKEAVAHALESSFGPGRALRGQLERFRDVLITDATVIRLHEMLQHTFPACRSNHTQAAAKLHLVMNVTGGSKQSVRVTAERAHENRALRIGPWVKGRLMLFDLGYYDFNLFARIHRHGGFFLSRLKSNANPTLTAVHRTRAWTACPILPVGRDNAQRPRRPCSPTHTWKINAQHHAPHLRRLTRGPRWIIRAPYQGDSRFSEAHPRVNLAGCPLREAPV